MRGTPWLVGLVCVFLVLVPTSVLVGAQEPQGPERRSPEAAGAARFQEWTGRSALHLKGACLEERATCVGAVSRDDGRFFLPSAAEGGSVVVSWRPADGSLRVLRVQAAGIEVTGESPLRIDFVGLVAGEHVVRIEPAGRVLGQHDQSADWIATFAVTPSPESVDTRGASTYQTRAGCALGTCDPLTTATSDAIVVPWTARGGLVADWDPDDGAMRVSVRGSGVVAEGTPPLALPLDGLGAGQWAIDARPAGLETPLADVTVGWHATLVRAG